MRFLVDAQLPPALARYLESAGHEAVHVADLRMERATDEEIWRTAAERGQAIVTKDEDFVALRVARGDGPAVWLAAGRSEPRRTARR